MSLRFCMAFLATALLLTSAVSAQTDWPQWQRDAARSGVSPDSPGVPDTGECTMTWRWHPDGQTSILGRVQPVVANGLLCVGFADGRLFALNTSDGSVAWSFQCDGPILHTAAMDANNVYVGCHDGKVYAVSQTTGQEVWSTDTGKAIYTAVCLADNKIFVGNGKGDLYALNVSDGSEAWTYSSGRPIQTNAAYSNGKVYCGNEGLYAFCVNASDGSEVWKVRLNGETLSSYGPVVMESLGTVFYRTGPLFAFHAALNEGDTVLGGNTGTGDYGDGTPSEFQTEYQNIRNYLNSNKHMQTMWALSTANGSEQYTPAVLYTAGEANVPVPPIFDPATGNMWAVARSKYARWDDGSMVRRFTEFVKLNPSTGEYTLFGTAATINDVNNHLIGDETTFLTADADGLYTSSRGSLGYIHFDTETTYHILSSEPNADDDYFHPDSPLAYGDTEWPVGSVLAGGGEGGGQCSGAIVAQNSIYWFARWGLLVRIDFP